MHFFLMFFKNLVIEGQSHAMNSIFFFFFVDKAEIYEIVPTGQLYITFLPGQSYNYHEGTISYISVLNKNTEMSQQTFDVRLTLKTRQILTLDLRCILVVFANCFDVRI